MWCKRRSMWYKDLRTSTLILTQHVNDFADWVSHQHTIEIPNAHELSPDWDHKADLEIHTRKELETEHYIIPPPPIRPQLHPD